MTPDADAPSDLAPDLVPDDADALPPPVEGGSIAGTVTDFDGHALVGVRVEAAVSGGADLDLLPVMTDGHGGFRLEGLAEGRSYDLRFEIGQVRARTLGVPVGTEGLGVQLARPRGLLLGVKTGGDDSPPDVLHVRLEREGQHGPVREYEGRHLTLRMLLWSIRPGTYTLTVWGGGYVPVQAHGVEVREGRPAPEVELVLSVKGSVIRGRVVDASGRPCPEALVAWRPLDGPRLRSRRECTAGADEHGAFRLTGLPAGRYLVSAGPESGPFADLEVAVADEASLDVELTLP